MAQKWPKITQNSPKITQNDPKMTQNGQKISTSWKKIAQIYLQDLQLFAFLTTCTVRCTLGLNFRRRRELNPGVIWSQISSLFVPNTSGQSLSRKGQGREIKFKKGKAAEFGSKGGDATEAARSCRPFWLQLFFFGSHTCPHYTGNREAGGTIDQVEIIEAFVVLD